MSSTPKSTVVRSAANSNPIAAVATSTKTVYFAASEKLANSNPIKSRLYCPRHNVPLILEEHQLTDRGRTLAKGALPGVVRFWRCPALINGHRCGFCRPCKYQRFEK